MKYEEWFGTAWSRLSFDEALLRAFALGITATDEEAPEDEFDRLRSTASSRYELQLIETAYIEGRQLESGGTPAKQITKDTIPEFIRRLDIDISFLFSGKDDSIQSSVPAALTRMPVQGCDIPEPTDLSLPDMLRQADR